jgi:hypothetical protein
MRNAIDCGEEVVAVLGGVAGVPDDVTTGDSGGMYQTMGMVRYSGCSGKATLKVISLLWCGYEQVQVKEQLFIRRFGARCIRHHIWSLN